MVRVSIGALLTEREHVEKLWRVMRREASGKSLQAQRAPRRGSD
jgi:hypothetical protein